MPSRMRIIYSNLKKAYPSWSDKKIRSFAFESGTRTIEMGLFVLASPYMKESNLKKRFKLSDSLKAYLKDYEQNPRPIVLLVPHFCMMESITMLPILHEAKTPRTGVFYRPMDNKAIDEWVFKTRTKYGINLISRRAGLTKAFDFLKDNGTIAVLFDQSVGHAGIFSYFFSMPCYSSNLAGLFVEKYKSDLGFMYAKRTGFFRAEIHAEVVECKKDNASVLIAGNKKLESLLKEDESLSADWLWLHNRWKLSRKTNMLLNLKHSKSLMQETRPQSDYKRQKIYLSLPTSTENILECVDLIKELALSREDAVLTLLVEKDLKDFVSKLNLGFEIIEIPRLKYGFFKYFKDIKTLQNNYVSLLIQFRQDKESVSIFKKLKAIKCIAISDTQNKKNGNLMYAKINPKLPMQEQYRAFLEAFGLPKLEK